MDCDDTLPENAETTFWAEYQATIRELEEEGAKTSEIRKAKPDYENKIMLYRLSKKHEDDIEALRGEIQTNNLQMQNAKCKAASPNHTL